MRTARPERRTRVAAREEVVSHGFRARAAADRVRGPGRPTPRDDQGSRGRGRGPAAPPPGRTQARAHARGATARDQGPTRPGRLPEREALGDPARSARAHRRAARGGREAHDAAVGVRHVPRHERRRHRRHLHRRPQDARRAAPRDRGRRAAPRPRGRAQRVAERRARPRRRRRRRSRDVQGTARGRHARARDRPRRRGARLRARRRAAAARRSAPATTC